MFKNYVHIIFRNLLKFRLFSFINIFGLALAIACSILVVIYIRNEFSFDTFHTNSDRIFRPYTYAKTGEREVTLVHTPFIMGKQLKENYPEVTAYTVLTEFSDQVKVKEQSHEETIHVASPDFFRMFDFPVLHGSTASLLSDPGSVAITKEIAAKYFGREEVVGERMTITLGGEETDFMVKAVLADMPSNTSIRFSIMIPDYYLKDLFPEPMLTSWHMITGETYVMLDEHADAALLPQKFNSLIKQQLGDDLDRMEFKIYLQPFTDIHMNTDLPQGNVPVSDPKYILILTGITVLILVIASINFVMLSLGRSFMRAKEIGIRKSAGATRSHLVVQFLSESIAISLFGLILGIGMVYLVLPWFNELAGQHLVLTLSFEDILIYLALAIFTGLLAGIYPALIMSGFKPVKILKGEVRYGKGNHVFGSILITGQFILFVILIGCTIVMKKQLDYLQHKNLGYDRENVLSVPMLTGDAKDVREVVKKGFEQARLFENEVRKIPEVVNCGIASHTFEPGRWTQIGYEEEGGQMKTFFYNTVDADFIPTMGIELVSGRNFQAGNVADQKRSIIVNESFIREFGLTQGIGERIPHDAFEDHEIIGVVKDFHIQSLHEKIQPLVLAMNVDIVFSGANNVDIGSSVRPKLFIRLTPDHLDGGLKEIEAAWNRMFPETAFDYEFVDQTLREQYEREYNLNKVVTSSSLLAVIVGCLGLFGISLLSYHNRLKEISIRKVLGASGSHILVILSRRFILLMLVALIISIPFTIQIMDRWLMEFEYRITINAWIFLLAGLISLLIIMATLSYQGISGLRSRPADNLRNE